jgi:hypothetical protein
MPRFKPSQRRSITQRNPIVPQRPRTLSNRAFVELGRQPGLGDIPKTAPALLRSSSNGAFAFLAYLVLGGA